MILRENLLGNRSIGITFEKDIENKDKRITNCQKGPSLMAIMRK